MRVQAYNTSITVCDCVAAQDGQHSGGRLVLLRVRVQAYNTSITVCDCVAAQDGQHSGGRLVLL